MRGVKARGSTLPSLSRFPSNSSVMRLLRPLIERNVHDITAWTFLIGKCNGPLSQINDLILSTYHYVDPLWYGGTVPLKEFS